MFPYAGGMGAVGDLARRSQPVVLAGERRLQVAAPLAPLLPGGGLRRGATVAVSAAGPAAGATSLVLALLSAPSAAGSWCAVVGVPDLGVAAAAQMGVRLERLALVARPGEQWPAVSAALLDSVDALFLRPPPHPRPADARRLVSRARERGAVLIVAGGGDWPGRVDVRLAVTAATPAGLGQGHGHLRERRVEVVAGGRGSEAGSRRVVLWLPDANGTAAAGAGVTAAAGAGVTAAAGRLSLQVG